MAIISKELFYKVVDYENCGQVLHPNFNGCLDSGLYILLQSIQGVFKFFVSIYIAELLMNHRKINNKEYLKKQLKYFLRSWAYGITMSITMFSSACLFRRTLGKFYYSTCSFFPGILSGLSIFWENRRMKQLDTIMFTTLALECGVKCLKGQEIIKRSIVIDTIFFMINNALFLYSFKTNALANRASLLWFFDPRPKNNEKENKSVLPCCDGINKCLKHILKDATKYFGTGYTFHLIKGLIPKLQKLTKNPLSIFSIIFNKKAASNGLFFGSYVLIYKLICRYLYEIDGKEKGVHSLIAGFVAGITYSINPSLQINLLPLTLTLQLAWINFREKYKVPKWYFLELFFALCCGVLFHFNFMLPSYTPTYVKKLINMAINGKGNIFINNVINHFEWKIKEKGIPITKHMYMTG